MAHDFSDTTLLAALREAARQAQESVDRSRTIIEETQALLRLAQRIDAPLIESR